jgi:hypothetical protein
MAADDERMNTPQERARMRNLGNRRAAYVQQ